MMRLPIALAALLLATAAQAQRVDTRTIDLRLAANGNASCRFNAMTDLHLRQGPTRMQSYAEWAHAARDGAAWLHARFEPRAEIGTDWRILMIEVPLTPALARATRAELSLDAQPSPVPVAVKRTWPGTDRLTITPADGAALAEAMRYTDVLSLRLLDARGRRIASREFWIGDLQNVAEYPGIIGWRCER